MIAAVFTVLAVLAAPTLEQDSQSTTPDSPCPNVFMYEPPGSEPGRWSGVVNLTTDVTLQSLWLNIVLDNKAEILGNWVGGVTTTDNIDFKIENTEMKINPGPALTVRFFVLYNPLNKTPRLQVIKWNGRVICNANTIQPTVDRPDLTQEPRPNPDTNIQRPDTTPSRLPSGPNVDIGPGDRPQTSPVQSQGNETVTEGQCGKVVFKYSTPLVVNGSPTTEGQWPWQIALYQTQAVNNNYKCGGTLLTHRHVITAAHCVYQKGSRRVVNKNTLTVYLGKHNLRTSVDGVQIRFVEEIHVHPDYNASFVTRDLAILELQKPVTYSDWVRPICLWPENEIDLKNVIGKKGWVVGWGFDQTGMATEDLRQIEMPVVDQLTCIRSHIDFFGRFTSDYTYCAGYRDGSSVCNGDSGGGMVFKKGDIWYLRGLVSLSVAKRNENLCDLKHYVIFTDIAQFLPWIKQNIFDY